MTRTPLYITRAYPGDGPHIYRRLIRKLYAERKLRRAAESKIQRVLNAIEASPQVQTFIGPGQRFISEKDILIALEGDNDE